MESYSSFMNLRLMAELRNKRENKMKISRKTLFYLTTLLLSLNFNVANAASVTIVKDAGTLQNTTALTGFATTGAMMDGMSLGITYGNGSTTTAFWADTVPADSGAASWAGGSLSLTGDSYTNSWDLLASGDFGGGISSILIDAGVGNSVFDTTFGDDWGTDGSAQGKDFAVVSNSADYDITATYIDAVGVGGAPAVGDLFRYLLIDFGQTAYAGTLSFMQDTDNLEFAGDINPVPVPAAAWLFGSALLGFFGFSRRKSQA